MRRVFAAVVAVVFGCASVPYGPTCHAPGVVEINDVTGPHMRAALGKARELVAQGDREIWFNINSFGGSVFAGWDFIQGVEGLIKTTPGLKTVCVADVKAYSMGLAILESGACGRRLMTKRATLLAHNASTSSEGNANTLESDAMFLRALDRSLAETIASRMGMSYADYAERVRTGDWSMSWADAVKYRAVDGIMDPKDIPPPYAVVVKRTIFDLLMGE